MIYMCIYIYRASALSWQCFSQPLEGSICFSPLNDHCFHIQHVKMSLSLPLLQISNRIIQSLPVATKTKQKAEGERWLTGRDGREKEGDSGTHSPSHGRGDASLGPIKIKIKCFSQIQYPVRGVDSRLRTLCLRLDCGEKKKISRGRGKREEQGQAEAAVLVGERNSEVKVIPCIRAWDQLQLSTLIECQT